MHYPIIIHILSFLHGNCRCTRYTQRQPDTICCVDKNRENFNCIKKHNQVPKAITAERAILKKHLLLLSSIHKRKGDVNAASDLIENVDNFLPKVVIITKNKEHLRLDGKQDNLALHQINKYLQRNQNIINRTIQFNAKLQG